MDYALNHFTMHNTQLFVVQGSHSLFTYQNIGTNTATIQGSNDASTWSDIASLASGASLVKEHSYKYLRCLGDTQVSVNRGDGDNTIGDGLDLGETSSTAYRGDNGKISYDHSLSQGNPHNTTTSDINEGTKLFFTESRVNQTVLTGLNTSTATPALATDQLLAAIGKLQAQINSMGSGGGSSGGITWVDVKTIGTLNSIIDNSYTEIEVAKIDGMLWLRGVIQITSNLTGNIFTVTNPSYFLTIKRPPASGEFYNPTTSDTVMTLFKITLSRAIGGVPNAYVLVNPSGGFRGEMMGTFNQASEYLVIPVTPIGQLLTP